MVCENTTREPLSALHLPQNSKTMQKLLFLIQIKTNWNDFACVSSLPISVGALYVRKYFNEESKKAAVDLVNNIRDEFINILNDVPWMDNITKDAAIEKARAMTSHIAYPDELTDNNKLEEYYNGLELEPDTLLKNVLRVRIFKDNHLIQKLRKPVNKVDWNFTFNLLMMGSAGNLSVLNSFLLIRPTGRLIPCQQLSMQLIHPSKIPYVSKVDGIRLLKT